MAARLGLVCALFTLVLCGSIAQAQQYQRLHVRSFTLRSDNAHPRVEQPFHVTLTIRVAENVTQLSNVFLPTFFGAEDLGDEQQLAHERGGSTYRETLTLVAHNAGSLSIGAAYLDAVDARDGKAKRFISNPLQLRVGTTPAAGVWRVFQTVAFVAIDLLLIGAAGFVVYALFWRRRRVPAPTPSATPVAPTAPKNDLLLAFENLRAHRNRASVLHVREVLWHIAGASAGETLGDVLRRPAAGDEHLRRMLMIVERAAFTEQSRLDEAIDDVLSEKEWTFA
jgi:hypothetical protein